MIKVQNGVATREPLPGFLVGLQPESLANLSWTDASLGVQDCAWLPEVVTAPEYNADTHKLGAEVLTVDTATKVVNVTYEVVPMTADELAAKLAAKRVVIQSQIDSLEGAPNYLNRGARELQLRLMEKEASELAEVRGVTKEQVLAATPYYVRLKALDQQIAELRWQL